MQHTQRESHQNGLAINSKELGKTLYRLKRYKEAAPYFQISADAYDALTSVRPYKHAWSSEDAVAYIKSESGKHFDPDCVKAFVARLDAVLDIQYRLRDDVEEPQLSAGNFDRH